MFNNNGKQSKEEYILSLKGKKSDTEIRKEIGKIYNIRKSQRNKKFRQIFENPGNSLRDLFDVIDSTRKRILKGVKEAANAESTIKAAHFKSKGDKGVAETDSPNIRTLEDLVKVCNIDLEEWQCKKFTGNSYGDNFQAKGEFERKKDEKAVHNLLEKFIIEAEKHSPKKFNIDRQVANGEDIYVISAQDLHIGKLSHGMQTGWGDYDISIAKEHYKQAVKELIANIDIKKIGKILLIIGSDTIHYENQRIETSSGTKIEGDSRWHKVFDDTCALISDTIEMLASKFKVEVVVIPGNHAKLSEYAMGSYIKAFFRHHPNVTVDNTPLNRKYFSHGKTLIGFCHGDGVKKLEELGAIIYRENQDTISKYKHIYWITGHKHTFQQMMDCRGVRIFVSAALCPPDQWHSENNYTGNIQSSEGYLFSPETGLKQIIFTTPVNIR